MIGELVLFFGPALLGLAFLAHVLGRFRKIIGGEIQPEFGERFRRAEHPGRYWLYVAAYSLGIALSVLALAWAALWIGYIWEARH